MTARWGTGGGGLPIVDLETAAGSARVYPYGAQVVSWRPAGQEDVLWLSPSSAYADGKAIRGGIPICFPWFGAKADDPAAPAHGFARTRPWTVEELGDDRIVLALEDDEATRARWPHAFRATLSVGVGAALELALEVLNRGPAPFRFEAALHGYLAVSDVERVRIRGLDVPYLDKTDGQREKRHPDPWTLAGETDAVHAGTEATVAIEDLARTLVLEKEGSRSTVVWNPGATRAASMADVGAEGWRRFVCVEAANVGRDAVRLEPGAACTLRQTIRCTLPRPGGR